MWASPAFAFAGRRHVEGTDAPLSRPVRPGLPTTPRAFALAWPWPSLPPAADDEAEAVSTLRKEEPRRCGRGGSPHARPTLCQV